jgi:hypothetical protein
MDRLLNSTRRQAAQAPDPTAMKANLLGFACANLLIEMPVFPVPNRFTQG